MKKMKINNKLIVAVSFVSSVVIIQIIIIKKLISKYKVINQLNYDLINERIRKLRERSEKTIEAVEEFKEDGIAIAEIAKIKTSDEKDEESGASRNSSSKPEQSSIKRGGKQK